MITEQQRTLFDALRQAFASGNACLLQCWELATGQPAFLVCAMVEDEDGLTRFIPLARTFERSPYGEFQPPVFDD